MDTEARKIAENNARDVRIANLLGNDLKAQDSDIPKIVETELMLRGVTLDFSFIRNHGETDEAFYTRAFQHIWDTRATRPYGKELDDAKEAFRKSPPFYSTNADAMVGLTREMMSRDFAFFSEGREQSACNAFCAEFMHRARLGIFGKSSGRTEQEARARAAEAALIALADDNRKEHSELGTRRFNQGFSYPVPFEGRGYTIYCVSKFVFPRVEDAISAFKKEGDVPEHLLTAEMFHVKHVSYEPEGSEVGEDWKLWDVEGHSTFPVWAFRLNTDEEADGNV